MIANIPFCSPEPQTEVLDNSGSSCAALLQVSMDQGFIRNAGVSAKLVARKPEGCCEVAGRGSEAHRYTVLVVVAMGIVSAKMLGHRHPERTRVAVSAEPTRHWMSATI
jgi:hypothetical protein